MFGHPVAVALAMARRIAKSLASIEITCLAGALIDAVWNPLTQRAATATACHWSVDGRKEGHCRVKSIIPNVNRSKFLLDIHCFRIHCSGICTIMDAPH